MDIFKRKQAIAEKLTKGGPGSGRHKTGDTVKVKGGNTGKVISSHQGYHPEQGENTTFYKVSNSPKGAFYTEKHLSKK